MVFLKLSCWRRLLKVPRTARTNQPILKEINPEYSWKDWCWSWSSNPSAIWCEELTHWKRPWCWKDWRQEEKGMTEDEMVRWHHWLKGHELEQTPEGGEGQGSLACYSQWGCKELDMIGWLNNNNNLSNPWILRGRVWCVWFHCTRNLPDKVPDHCKE